VRRKVIVTGSEPCATTAQLAQQRAGVLALIMAVLAAGNTATVRAQNHSNGQTLETDAFVERFREVANDRQAERPNRKLRLEPLNQKHL